MLYLLLLMLMMLVVIVDIVLDAVSDVGSDVVYECSIYKMILADISLFNFSLHAKVLILQDLIANYS